MTFFNPPRAPESNPPIQPQYFVPNAFEIADISMGPVTTVTTDTTFYGHSNNYVIGQLVRFLIPRFYGAQELNNQTGYVIEIPGVNQIVVGINSTGFSPFIANPDYGPTPPQILAIGDVNTGVINTGRSNNGTFIPGSFINISPQ